MLIHQFTTPPTRFTCKSHHIPFQSFAIKASTASGGNDQPPPSPPPSSPGIRFRRESRKRRRRQQQQHEVTGNGGVGMRPKTPAPKEWESMSLSEKAAEMYMGEKGFLFWLNKFAYASIFIVIGGWIIFRFVGPALNLYQLETPPLAPESLLKGS
ncbi:unnamed protein product [Cuscuta epithymum]|uniref:Uncharacterized protein n=1 Tax=Cuscuta epithymum TaxID=186058 RepID=A0AAV0D478_9ASTE|nr:unnamed protein product [Cuscuta epithymum]